jgi:hypothetical protein
MIKSHSALLQEEIYSISSVVRDPYNSLVLEEIESALDPNQILIRSGSTLRF